MKPPKIDDLDEEIRGHLEIAIKERIERGEDPKAARLAAIKEFGNVLLTRESIQRVWRPGWLDAAEALVRDIRFAVRSLWRAKGLTAAGKAQLGREQDRWARLVDAIGRIMNTAPDTGR